MEELHQKITIQEVAKHPLAYVLMVAMGVAWFFVYQFSGASSLVNKNCEEEKAQLRLLLQEERKEKNEERKEKNELYNASLVSTGVLKIIDKKTETDSLKTTQK